MAIYQWSDCEYSIVILCSMSIEILKQLYRLSDAVLQDSKKDTVWVFTPKKVHLVGYVNDAGMLLKLKMVGVLDP